MFYLNYIRYARWVFATVYMKLDDPQIARHLLYQTRNQTEYKFKIPEIWPFEWFCTEKISEI